MRKYNKPPISIILCSYNDGKYLRKCLDSILNQSYTNYELIIVNDGSTDNTEEIISEYKDTRIKYFKTIKNSGSIAKVRNFAISKSSGKYLFFTDTDCFVPKNWLEEGLKAFRYHNTYVIEGKIIYASTNYKPTLSDITVSNTHGGEWMMANMAFKKSIIKRYCIDNKYWRLEDRELALRIIRRYEIPFVPSFLVYHQIKKRTIKSYFLESKRYELKVKMIKSLKDEVGNQFRILSPKYFILLLFPPLIITEFILGRIKSWDDLKLLPFIYPKAIYMRAIIWKTAIKEKVFVL